MLTWLILSLSSTAGTVLSTAKRCEAAAGTTEGVSGTLRTVECTEEVFVTAIKNSLETDDDNQTNLPAGGTYDPSISRGCIGQEGDWSLWGW